ncbi:sbcc family protein [Photobacterium carnosum]|uniref:DNA repair protein n=1 Tax=Photobacterium carnosum TaxID=2023717 RepID=UPI00128CF1E8|nr:DNA repair protein [Photobacterium carnosum]KAE8177771.1 DNA repair protein [Photobacterium carnosum]
MKIKKVEIEAFRAYQSKSNGTFDFTNDRDEPANFVAIYAPNGFGKSSFYDAVEWAVTNRVKRLENYQNEAKSTKRPDEGLKILRNKYVDETIATTVVLSTNDRNVFERNLPRIRKNQNDMSLGDRENEFFRHAILSQDEIEGFLREEKPQDRYSKFMDSFGGDIETARKELSALINDNKYEVSDLDKKCKCLLRELKKPIDLSIFEQFNSVAIELNSLGESIVLPDESLSTHTLQKLDSKLVSRQHELNTSLQTNSYMLESLLEQLTKMPEVELHAGYVIEQKTKLAKLLKGVSDADKYKGLLDSSNKCVEDLKQANERLSKLIEISENIEFFLQTESRIKDITKIKNVLTDEYSRLNAELAGFQKNLEELNKELKKDDDRASLLRSSVDNSGPVYAELSNNQKRLDVLNQQITEKIIEIQADKSQQEKLSSEQSELSVLNITSVFLLAGNMGSMNFEKEKVDQIAKYHSDLELLEVHKQALHATQKVLTEQMESHERLISIGLDYLSVEPSHICPLCTAPYSSPEELIGKVKSQNLLSELSKENSQKITHYSTRQDELKVAIQEITIQAVESQAHQLTEIRNKLYEIGVKFTRAEQEKNTFEAESKNLEHRKVQLESLVWSLSHQELVTRVEADLNQLFLKRSNLTQKQENLAAQIQIVTESLKTNGVECSRLESEMETKSRSHVYVSLLAYINENAIAAQEINAHCEIKKQELEEVVRGYITSCEFLASHCHDLQQEMTADGTWVDFSNLNKEKEAIEVAFTNSQSEVNAFYMSLSNIISIHSDDTLDQVKTLITIKTEECQVYAHALEKLLNGTKLLLELMTSFKPYIKHFSTQKERDTLVQHLEWRNQVNGILVAERNVIIEKLELLINNFFFEDLINSIYRKIDPHPSFKKVKFNVSFETEKPTLNILVSDDAGGMISPILYFSTAQTNILSLSVFLANALHAKDDEGNPVDVILIDDPIQSMDSINVLSTIDLLRSICLQFDKQLIISTHDENFFGLLQRKIPSEIFGSKFLQLEKFGVVVPVEPICR